VGNETIQSIETNQEEEGSLSVLNRPYLDELPLSDKIHLVKEDFESRFPSNEQLTMTRKENFLRHYPLLGLLNRIKSINESIENAQKDRASIQMLLDLYASQLIELDTRLEKKLLSLGEWLPEVLDRFIDGGYSMYNRYFTYNLLGYRSEVVTNKSVQFNHWKVLLLRIFFLGIVLTGGYLLFRSHSVAGVTKFILKKSTALQIGSFILIFLGVISVIYTPALDYWLRDWLDTFKDHTDEVREQIRFHVAELNDLAGSVASLREEMKFQLQELIEASMEFRVQSSYDTYLSFNEIKNVLANERMISKQKRDILLILLGIKNMWQFFGDYGFAYWVLKRHVSKALLLFGAICIGFIHNYATIPFMSNISVFWQSLTADLAVEGLFSKNDKR